VEGKLDLERERRLHALLVEALALPVERRRGHVVAAAGDDDALAAEVLDLLGEEDCLEELLETPAAVELGDDTAQEEEADAFDGGGEAAAPAALPSKIGPFAILERPGSGGMGEVFRALQAEPVRREVALKRVRTHLPPRRSTAF
jgi:hypothetical protein